MRWTAPLLLGLIGCAPTDGTGERVRATEHRFTSAHAVLLDFELDGVVSVDDASSSAAVTGAIVRQLEYSIGQLYAEAAGGHFERLTLSAVTPSVAADAPADAPRHDVRYHAKLPVAWGARVVPDAYTLVLPRRISPVEEASFAAKYGATCADPLAGPVDRTNMFVAYRPHRPGCALDDADVASFRASVSRSPLNTTGKYPEYHRIWEDGSLDVAALFTRAERDAPPESDQGIDAYRRFVLDVDALLARLQPDPERRSPRPSLDPGAAALAATLPDGRRVRVEARLVGYRLTDDGGELDRWYDRVSADADLVLFGGHAGLGDNIRSLAGKGTFRPGKYLLMVLNGCDTFAYTSRELAERRALVNPDDPGGTRYLDTVTNVMAGYFSTVVEMPIAFVEAAVVARDPIPRPQTFEQILARLDPHQLPVVTGDEDNVFEPSMFPPIEQPGPVEAGPSADEPRVMRLGPDEDRQVGDAPTREAAGCNATPSPTEGRAGTALTLALVALARRRPRGRARAGRS